MAKLLPSSSTSTLSGFANSADTAQPLSAEPLDSPCPWPLASGVICSHDRTPHERAERRFNRANIAANIPGSKKSSGGGVVVCPRGVLVVGGAVFQTSVQDADVAVGELAERGLVADLSVA